MPGFISPEMMERMRLHQQEKMQQLQQLQQMQQLQQQQAPQQRLMQLQQMLPLAPAAVPLPQLDLDPFAAMRAGAAAGAAQPSAAPTPAPAFSLPEGFVGTPAPTGPAVQTPGPLYGVNPPEWFGAG